MIAFPAGVRVWLAVGRTDMRRGMNGLALQVQEALGRDPHGGDLYVFRGARGDLINSASASSPAGGPKCCKGRRQRQNGHSPNARAEYLDRVAETNDFNP
jgi:transposase